MRAYHFHATKHFGMLNLNKPRLEFRPLAQCPLHKMGCIWPALMVLHSRPSSLLHLRSDVNVPMLAPTP